MIERASPTDRAFLAMDRGEVREQFGVVLRLDTRAPADAARIRALIAERVATVPRLRRRLRRTPPGCGGPVWADDPDFDPHDHIRVRPCPAPGDERALLDTALSLVASPLPPDAPLWAATVLTGLADGGCALVLTLHHVLADGVGGLAVLMSLADGAEPVPTVNFPEPMPTWGALARDAWRTRLAAVRRAGRSWPLLRAAMRAGGGARPPRAAPSSLNRVTGPRRWLGVVHADLGEVRAAAHRYGATANDLVLTAVAGALRRVLEEHGEVVDAFTVTVPVSGRQPGAASELGNMVSPMLVRAPATGAVPERLRQIGAQVRAQRAAATGPPPIALLGWLFRPLASLGGFNWYMNHQHRFHTLVSHVRGPAEQVAFGGIPVTSAVPVGVGPGGNITVYFEVLSYAGALTVAAVADPDHFADPEGLVDALSDELDRIVRPA